jgi:hypothetical protein
MLFLGSPAKCSREGLWAASDPNFRDRVPSTTFDALRSRAKGFGHQIPNPPLASTFAELWAVLLSRLTPLLARWDESARPRAAHGADRLLGLCGPGGRRGRRRGRRRPASASEGESHSAGSNAGAILADVLYVPGKIVFAGLGAVTSGLTYLVTLGNSEATRSVWDATVEGTYVITPRHIEGKEPVRFIGP